MSVGVATLGGIRFYMDPDRVEWQFSMKTAEFTTVGGKVVQVFGTDLGPMTVSGAFVPHSGKLVWEVQQEFLEQVKEWAEETESNSGASPLVFSFPPRNWNFRVFINAIRGVGGGAAIEDDAGNFNPKWELELFIVEDTTRQVTKGIKDAYIDRLMNGIGWKQTEFNGPTQGEVDELLSPYGGDAEKYLVDQLAEGTDGE